MSSTGVILLGIIWLLLSPVWFWAENTAMGVIWLCAGILALILAFIKRNQEKKK